MKNIFVGNLSFGTSEQDIRSLFEAHGVVERVNLVSDRETGQPRGFAFVEMTNDAEGDRAIDAVNGKELGGRTLNVNEARPKSEGGGRQGGNGGGRGGRGNSGGYGRKPPRWESDTERSGDPQSMSCAGFRLLTPDSPEHKAISAGRC